MTSHSPSARRALISSILGSSLLLLAACGPKPAPPPVVPAVFVSPVRNDSAATERVLFGSLRPRVESDVSFRVGGKVIARAVELGQSVRAGQVLGRIDPADVQLAMQAATEQQRAAEVDAVQAASDAARFKRLLADGSVGAADAERQQARADAAAARLAQAQRQTELAGNRAGYAVLNAPFDGIVTAVRFETGQMVNDSQTVLSLAKPDELELQADVPEAMVAGLNGWQASARLATHQGVSASPKDLPLRLREVAPSAASASRTYRARFGFSTAPAGVDVRMGMTAELRLAQPGRTPGAELPVSALLATGASNDETGSTFSTSAAVWLVDANTGALARTPVQLLSQSTDHIRVAGLPDGALVVTVGAQKLDAGLKVRPVQRPLPSATLGGTAAGR
jgi:membrane fusion protein, multidrug efflux system